MGHSLVVVRFEFLGFAQQLFVGREDLTRHFPGVCWPLVLFGRFVKRSDVLLCCSACGTCHSVYFVSFDRWKFRSAVEWDYSTLLADSGFKVSFGEIFFVIR